VTAAAEPTDRLGSGVFVVEVIGIFGDRGVEESAVVEVEEGVEAAEIPTHRSDPGVFLADVIEDFDVRGVEESAAVDADAGAEDAEVPDADEPAAVDADAGAEDAEVPDADEPAAVDADAGAEDAESGQGVPLAPGCALPVAVGVCWLGDGAAVVAAGAAVGTDALAC
jgi:hypothetical protein